MDLVIKVSGMYSTIIKLQAYEREEGKNDWDVQMFDLKEEIALRK